MKRIKTTCLEMLAVCIAAALVGVVANAIHADGIEIARNYFSRRVVSPPEENAASGGTGPETSHAHEDAKADEQDRRPGRRRDDCLRREENGLSLACFDFVSQHHAAMPDNPGFIVFVDARDEESYREEHISGALHVDHYRQDRYLPEVLPLLQGAGIIIVYCTGGDCEDSIFLATSLITEHGLPLDAIYVYEGGLEEWKAKGKPLREGGQP